MADDTTRTSAPGGDAHQRSLARQRDEQLTDIDWSALPAGAHRESFSAPSGELAVLVFEPSGTGSAAPVDQRNAGPVEQRRAEDSGRVVLVPGVTGSKEDFALLGPLLAGRGYLVQSFDIAGQYDSADAGPADGGHYDYDLFERDLIAFLSSGPPAHLLGYSFAGVLAQTVAVARPELVRSLTLLTTPPDPGQGFRSVRWIGPLSWMLNGRQGAGLMIWGIVTNKNRVGPNRLRFVRDRFTLTRRASVDDVVGLMKRIPDRRDAIRATGIPVLVATGDHDLWPVRRHAAFARSIGARLAVYRTGHSPCETAPNELSLDMLELFARAVG